MDIDCDNLNMNNGGDDNNSRVDSTDSLDYPEGKHSYERDGEY